MALAYSPWLLIIYLIILTFSIQLDSNDQDIIKGFIEWFGTAYSLFLALVLVNTWAQYDVVEREFDRELDAIVTLYQTTQYAREIKKRKKNDVNAFKEDIKRIVIAYLKHVINNFNKEHLFTQQRNNGDDFLEKIGNRISLLAQDQIIVDALTTELFRSLNEFGMCVVIEYLIQKTEDP